MHEREDVEEKDIKKEKKAKDRRKWRQEGGLESVTREEYSRFNRLLHIGRLSIGRLIVADFHFSVTICPRLYFVFFSSFPLFLFFFFFISLETSAMKNLTFSIDTGNLVVSLASYDQLYSK